MLVTGSGNGRPLTDFGRRRPNLPLPLERVKRRLPFEVNAGFGKGLLKGEGARAKVDSVSDYVVRGQLLAEEEESMGVVVAAGWACVPGVAATLTLPSPSMERVRTAPEAGRAPRLRCRWALVGRKTLIPTLSHE